MKKLLLLLLIGFISFQSFAQDPDLYQTWYLTDYDFGEEYFVIDINPPINPTLTIEENLDFSGTGACNEFFGSFIYDNGALIVSNFIPTLSICDHPEHMDFELQYFGYFYPDNLYSIEIYTGVNYQTLSLDGPLFNGMNFSNHPLSTTVHSLNSIKISPNPVFNTLFISSENTVIKKLVVYNISGKIVIEQNNNQDNSLDVSRLSKGMYFLELSSETGKTVKKFIKK